MSGTQEADGQWTGSDESPLFSSFEASMIKVGRYRFNVTAPVGCTRLCVGETAMELAAPRPIIAKVIEPEDLQEFFVKEGRVLHTLHNRPHPGFPKLQATVTGEDGRSFIVMDGLGIDLNTYVRAERGLPEEEVKVLFKQIVSAVAHCHKNRVVLRDMKLGKIFFSNHQCTNLVFADMDGAEVMTGGRIGQLRDQKGSPAYVCPEVLCCKPYDGYAADMWSLGVVLYRMLTGIYPFLDTEPARLFDKILLGSSAIHFPPTVSMAARNVIRQLLERNPQSRPDAATLLQHEWLQHDRAEGMALLRQRSLLSSTSLGLLSSRMGKGSLFGGLEAAAAAATALAAAASKSSVSSVGSSSVGGGGGGGRGLSSSSSSSSIDNGSRLMRRRSSSGSSTGSEEGSNDLDGNDQQVPEFDDNEDSKEPITPTGSVKSFGNLGGSTVAVTVVARNKRPTAGSINPALIVAEKFPIPAKKRQRLGVASERAVRGKVVSAANAATRKKGFVRPAGLPIGWNRGIKPHAIATVAYI